MRRSRRPHSAAATALLALLLPGVAEGQYSEAPPPAAWALENVTVVHADGTRRQGVTVVVRGAFLEALAPDADVPPDARRLEGDSLLVYPGLIDALGEAAHEFPEPEVDRRQLQSWAPSREAQSFVPHRRVVDHLQATGADLAELRRKGVVAVAVHPEGRLMPGRGAFLLARRDAAAPRELVLDPALGPTFTLQGAQGAYPGTLFGVIAFTRQALEDARRDARLAEAHARGPRNLEPPRWDPDREVLREVLDGAVPVFYAARSAGDIRRVLDLAGEYGFRPVVVGADEAWKVSELLREREVTVLVSLDFPEPRRWKPEEAPDTAAPAPPEPLDAEARAEKERLEAIYANAGRLVAAGVDIALTSGGGEAELLEGARKAIAHGLPADAALAALTSVPAGLYGAPELARLEPGLPATFIVTDGPLFEEGTRVLYTFVEGLVEEGTAPAARRRSENGDDRASSLEGEWDVSYGTAQGDLPGSMELTQAGSRFEGTLTLEFGEVRVREGTVSDRELTFQLEIQGQSSSFSGTLSDDGRTITASGSTPFGPGRIRASRRDPGGVR